MKRAVTLSLALAIAAAGAAADWPTYRHDNARSAVTLESLETPLAQRWALAEMAELRWRLVGIDLGKLLRDGTSIALDLHVSDLDTSDLTAALVRGIGFGLRGDPRGMVDVPRELEALAKLAGGALVAPEGSS